ncbi:DNA polymerase III subunit beta [Candidatus Cyrtobacter comes]|uniref:Beta sliding clamp n=1 Tax=Candidatus Cyrtobacter comes TaxID=675776 RepID=A0ABU5L6F8_9RICK|nr:DNA polymerase III subunit beta [Candidatus Cyrtobacter comes]MDZ5761713.1 DNA polymerase III subunit beta [Candidatus Cyrtobacter comes]
MEFAVSRGSLLKSLSRLASIVEKRSAIPILSNVKVTLFNLSMRLLATDMDLYVEDEIELEESVDKSISVTVPMHMFLEIVKRVPEHIDLITMISHEKDSSFVEVMAGTAKCKLPSLPAQEFPSIISEEYLSKFKISAEKLYNILSTTKYAAPTEDTRYYLNGIYIHILEKNGAHMLRAVSTDGHRMACADTLVSENSREMPPVIIPKKSVLEILRLLPGIQGEIEISVSNNIIGINFGTVKLVSKLVDGKFLDYAKAIPSINKKIVVIDSKELRDAINLVSAVSYDKSKAVRFKIAHGKITLFAESISDIGACAQQEVSVDYNSDQELDIAFNSRYVIDVLASIEDKIVKFCFANSQGAALVCPIGSDDSLHVIMPMQL